MVQLVGLWYAVGRDRIELRFIEALVSGRKKDEKNARMRIKLARAKADSNPNPNPNPDPNPDPNPNPDPDH